MVCETKGIPTFYETVTRLKGHHDEVHLGQTFTVACEENNNKKKLLKEMWERSEIKGKFWQLSSHNSEIMTRYPPSPSPKSLPSHNPTPER